MSTFRPSGLRFFTVAVLVAGCGDHGTNFDGAKGVTTIHGSGVLAEEERPMSGFSAASFAAYGSLRVVQGSREALHIRAEDNLLPYLVTEVNNGLLGVRIKSGFDLEPTEPIEFHLTVVDLERFRFTGVGDVEISDLTAGQLFLDFSGVGTLDCSNLDAGALDVTLSGIGDTRVSGNVDVQFVQVLGLGDYEARDLTSREATVTIRSSGSATLRVSDRLVVWITGSGWVRYIGNPIVESTVTGSGRVVRLP